MLSRRAELIALCALVLAVLSFVMTLQPHWPAIAAGPGGPDGPDAVAAIPTSLNYQGVLRLANGSLANGTYNMVFRIYSVAAGGTALYAETINGVVVRDGVFNVVLGDTTAIPNTVFADAPRFIGVQVGTDPEMVPRQRLHPVPWAQQATNAVNAANAQIATTLAPNASISGLTVNGLTVDGVFNLRDRLTVDASRITLSKDVVAQQDLTVSVRRDIGSRNAPVQITRADYDTSIRRYVIEAPDGGTTPNSVPIDDDLLMQLCGDLDGCTFTLGMRNFATTVTGPNILATIGPFRLSIGPVVDGKRYWDLRFADGNSIQGHDANGSVQHVARGWGCFFTDGKYLSAQGTDTALGFELLNWFGEYDGTDMVCVLIIED